MGKSLTLPWRISFTDKECPVDMQTAMILLWTQRILIMNFRAHDLVGEKNLQETAGLFRSSSSKIPTKQRLEKVGMGKIQAIKQITRFGIDIMELSETRYPNNGEYTFITLKKI